MFSAVSENMQSGSAIRRTCWVSNLCFSFRSVTLETWGRWCRWSRPGRSRAERLQVRLGAARSLRSFRYEPGPELSRTRNGSPRRTGSDIMMLLPGNRNKAKQNKSHPKIPHPPSPPRCAQTACTKQSISHPAPLPLPQSCRTACAILALNSQEEMSASYIMT